MALRKWNKGKIIFPSLHSLPKQQMWRRTLESHFIFTGPKNHFLMTWVSMSSCFMSTQIQEASCSWGEGSSLHMKHGKKTHSDSENCSCLSHLTAFRSTLWTWQGRNLEGALKGQLPSPSGLYPKDWRSPVLLAALPQGRCPGSLRGEAGSWAPRVGLASSQARASKTGSRAALFTLCYKNGSLGKARNQSFLYALKSHKMYIAIQFFVNVGGSFINQI